MLWQGLCWSVQIKKDVRNAKEFKEIWKYLLVLFFLGSFYLVLLLPNATSNNLCLEHRIAYILWFHFGWIFNAYPISRPFLMKIHVKYLRHDSHKITFKILTMTIDEVIIGSIFVYVSVDLQSLRLLYCVYSRLRKFLPLKWKAKLNTRCFSGLVLWWVWKKV